MMTGRRRLSRCMLVCALLGCGRATPGTSSRMDANDAAPSPIRPGPVRTQDAGSDGGDSGTIAMPSRPGDWIEKGLYRLRIGRIQPCQDVPPARRTPGAIAGDGGGATTDPTPNRRWIGVFMEIAAGKKAFITPRDVTLERAGIVLDAKFHEHPVLPACAPLMPQKLLGAAQVVSGFVLFEVPASFDKAPGATIVAYRPTRWGRSPRVEIPVPACFDACEKAHSSPPSDAGKRRGVRAGRDGGNRPL